VVVGARVVLVVVVVGGMVVVVLDVVVVVINGAAWDIITSFPTNPVDISRKAMMRSLSRIWGLLRCRSLLRET